MKKPIIVLFALLSSLRLVYAQDTIGDCSIFSQNTIPDVSFVDSFDLGDIYPKVNRTIAINNLKKYCCSEYKSESKTQSRGCESTTDRNFANSNMLYDHLIDVGFRSLDGDMSLAYEGQVIDPLGKVRHEALYGTPEDPGYSNNPLGAVPLQIWKDFGLYRGINEQGSLNYSLNEFKNPKDNKDQYTLYKTLRTDIPTADQKNDEYVGLASRYLIICHVSQAILANGGKQTEGFGKCKQLALERIHHENVYVEYILSSQGMTALMSNFNAYAQGYFVQGELARLLEKITEMNAGLTYINSKVSSITRMCSA